MTSNKQVSFILSICSSARWKWKRKKKEGRKEAGKQGLLGHRDKRGESGNKPSQEMSLSPRPASWTVGTDFLSPFAL